MTKLHCDVCDRVINETDALIRIRYTYCSEFRCDNGRRERKSEEFKSLDICVDCRDKIKDFVEKMTKNSENCAEKV